MGRGAEGEDRAHTGGMDCAGEDDGAEGREITARVAEDETQIRHQRRMGDCGTRGREGQRGGHAGGISEGRCSVCGRAVCWKERKPPADLRSVAKTWQVTRRRCEGVSVQDDCATVSQTRFRADQTNDEYADRSWFCAHTLQGKTAQAVYGYWRAGEEGPDHASHRIEIDCGDRWRSEEVVKDSIRA